ELLGELDRLVDYDAIRDVGRVLQLEGREQQDAALDRGQLLGLAVERRRDQELERGRFPDSPLEEPREILRVGLGEFLRLRGLGLQSRSALAGHLPGVERLHHELARAPSRGFHRWLFAAALARFAISTATSAQSRPFRAARSAAWSSVSAVRMPFATGIPLSSCTCISPDADSLATTSK